MSTEPPLSRGAKVALQGAFAVFHEQGEWPSFQYIDHLLDRSGEETAAALAGLPTSLAHFDRMTPRLSAISLTFAGICAAEGSSSEQALFLRLIAWCVAREREFAPSSPTGPSEWLEVDATEFAEESPGPGLDEIDQRKALSFIRTEFLAASSAGPSPTPPVWTATLDARVRDFRAVETVDDYLAAVDPNRTPPAVRIASPGVLSSPAEPPGLGRGQRVNLVKAASLALSRMGATDRGLTLRGFGIEGKRAAREETYAFLTRVLLDVGDGALLEIASYLEEIEAGGEPLAAAEEEIPGAPWEAGRFRLFLSHTHPFAPRLVAIKEELAPLGIDAFVAHVDIAPSEAWEVVIEAALRSCDALAAFLSEDFAASSWTDQEVGWVAGRGRPVIAIDHACGPYGFIAKWQSVKASRPDLTDALVGVLATHERTARRMAEVQVALLERAASPAEGRLRLELLERVGPAGWSEALLGRVEAAVGGERSPGDAALIELASGLVARRRLQRP